MAGDLDDWYAVLMAEKDLEPRRQAAKQADFTLRYSHIFEVPAQRPLATWMNFDYGALELRVLAEMRKQDAFFRGLGYTPTMLLHDEIVYEKKGPTMNEKRAKEALEAARLFISGLSQYNNLIMPKSAFEEARGVLAKIGRAQNVEETPVTSIEINPGIGGEHPSIFGGIRHEGNCGVHRCICDKVLFANDDGALWQRVKSFVVLHGITSKTTGAMRVRGRSPGRSWRQVPEADALIEALERCTLKPFSHLT